MVTTADFESAFRILELARDNGELFDTDDAATLNDAHQLLQEYEALLEEHDVIEQKVPSESQGE